MGRAGVFFLLSFLLFLPEFTWLTSTQIFSINVVDLFIISNLIYVHKVLIIWTDKLSFSTFHSAYIVHVSRRSGEAYHFDCFQKESRSGHGLGWLLWYDQVLAKQRIIFDTSLPKVFLVVPLSLFRAQ